MVLENTKAYKKPSTVDTTSTLLKTPKKYVIDKNITKYTVKDIEDVAYKMYSKGLASGSIKNLLGAIKRAFDIGIKLGIIGFNPVFNIKIPTRKIRSKCVYTKEQIKILLDNSCGELRTYLYVAIYTGARPGEILALTKEDIQGDYISISKTLINGTKTLQTPKNGCSRLVFIPECLRQELKDFKAFTIKYTTLLYKFKKLCMSLEVPYSGLHSLRHSYASILLNNKVNPMIIKEALGHKDLSMINTVYGHFLGYREQDKEAIKSSLDF
ncbi:tyrosine-type recombinase/integrase [Campylobacter sp. 7477a]|uniref:tyrosine-type recombinase/integrase n=1 Tax=Campylobacter sp. 7477a TaxID=2735741 RepID=UPI00301565D5|nr:site-specific integrase [Campylobacter sp. 7477a]